VNTLRKVDDNDDDYDDDDDNAGQLFGSNEKELCINLTLQSSVVLTCVTPCNNKKTLHFAPPHTHSVCVYRTV
jgi:hypothetical protein